jgi:hypothetical protein
MELVIFEIIGYLASVVVAISLMMSRIIKLRWINFVGSGLFSLYGFLIHSYPVALLNGFIAIVNIYYLVQIYKSKEYFRILESKNNSNYLQYFLDFHRKEIEKYNPKFDFKIGEDDKVFYILRDMVPAGLLIGEIEDLNINIKLDFVIPAYRDFKVGKYLYQDHKGFLKDRGFRSITTKSSSESQARYLQKMGFTKKESKEVYEKYELKI